MNGNGDGKAKSKGSPTERFGCMALLSPSPARVLTPAKLGIPVCREENLKVINMERAHVLVALVIAAPAARCLSLGTVRRASCPVMNQDGKDGGMPGIPSFEQFKEMMATEATPEKLGLGEQVQRGVGGSWANPAYWSRQFVQASHISNNVPNNSNVIELGKDPKNLYYLNSPASCTLIVPPSNANVKEGPLREAAAKLGVPFTLFTEQPLDTLPIRTNSFDAALCMDMLDGAPQQAAAGALVLLHGALKSNGRLLFLERKSVGLPALAREYGFNVDFDEEGGFDVGIATKRVVGKTGRKKVGAAAKGKKGPSKADRAAMQAKGGFGGGVGKTKKPASKAASRKAVAPVGMDEVARVTAEQAKASEEAPAAEAAKAEAANAANAEAANAANAETAERTTAAAVRATKRTEDELRRLLTKELIDGQELTEQEDAWVDEVMETQAELYDRIDAELVSASKSK